jgi:hypothetical protein
MWLFSGFGMWLFSGFWMFEFSFALLCFALPCFALLYFALPCFALLCFALRCCFGKPVGKRNATTNGTRHDRNHKTLTEALGSKSNVSQSLWGELFIVFRLFILSISKTIQQSN